MTGPKIVIDGSKGEGGGQILRTSVALAAALAREVRVTNIRTGRSKAGLRPQHLAAVRAAAAVCNGTITGDRIGSGELTFLPGQIAGGDYRFDIGTAGSTVLLLQTVIPALMLTDADSKVTVRGGTHNPFAPCFEYLRDVFAVLASAANLQVYFESPRRGFYPAGGGEVRMEIGGVASRDNIAPLRYVARGELRRIEGISAISSTLPAHVAERQSGQVLGLLAKADQRGTIEQTVWDTPSPGAVVFMRAVFARSVAGFAALGARGKPAERVADEAVLPLLEFLDSPGVVDCHAADQLLTLAALSPDESRFRTDRVTSHLLTNATVVETLTERRVRIDGELGQPGEVIVTEAI